MQELVQKEMAVLVEKLAAIAGDEFIFEEALRVAGRMIQQSLLAQQQQNAGIVSELIRSRREGIKLEQAAQAKRADLRVVPDAEAKKEV